MAQDRRYRTEISVKTVIEGDGQPDADEKFFEANLIYHGLPAEGVSLIEQEMIGVQQRLRQKGDDLARSLQPKTR